MGVIQSRATHIVEGLTDTEVSMGVDLKLTSEGDLEISNLHDIKLVAGVDNAAQAINLKLNIEPGGLLYHSEIGTNLYIGEKVKDALAVKLQILRSLINDERFSDIDAKVQLLGNTYVIDLKLTLANSGIEVPLQFSVVNQ